MPLPHLCALVAASLFTTASLHAATLIHYYPFTSDLNDSVGSNNGALVGSATLSNGSVDTAGGYVQFDTHLVPTSGSYSVLLFAKLDHQPGGIAEMISQGSSGGPGFYIGTDGGSHLRVTDSWGSTSITYLYDSQWHQYAMTVDAATDTSSFYIDGQLQGTHSAISTTPGGTDTRLGNQFAPYGENFPGQLDDLRIYTGSLTQSEVLATLPEPSLLFPLATALTLLPRRRKPARHF